MGFPVYQSGTGITVDILVVIEITFVATILVVEDISKDIILIDTMRIRIATITQDASTVITVIFDHVTLIDTVGGRLFPSRND